MTVTINGTTGYSGPVGTIGDLTTTGNTTLGDASGDTLTLNGNTASIPNGLNFTNGNIGIGVTPSAWSGFTALQIQNGALFTDSTSFRFIMNGYYNGSNWIYSTTNAATRYEQLSGIHRWFNAPSGTAGSAITFTQAMTLDASGNLGIGTTSPSARIDVSGSGSNAVALIQATRSDLSITTAMGSDGGLSGGFVRTVTNHPLVFGTNNTERARIDSSGNFGIGVAPSNARLMIKGDWVGGHATVKALPTTSFASGGLAGYGIFDSDGSTRKFYFVATSNDCQIWGQQNTPMVFGTSDTERARITSTGAFGIGNSSPSYLLDVGANSGNDALIRGMGAFLVRKYSFSNNGTTARTLRLSITNNGLQFSNFFMDASAHYYNNGGSWQAARFAFQFMAEGGTLRLNQRMPNYEYGGSTSAVFSVGNPPSWTYAGNNVWYFDFTVNGGFVSYISLIANGPGIQDLTLVVL